MSTLLIKASNAVERLCVEEGGAEFDKIADLRDDVDEAMLKAEDKWQEDTQSAS